jgi:hypothetical protein
MLVPCKFIVTTELASVACCLTATSSHTRFCLAAWDGRLMVAVRHDSTEASSLVVNVLVVVLASARGIEDEEDFSL